MGALASEPGGEVAEAIDDARDGHIDPTLTPTGGLDVGDRAPWPQLPRRRWVRRSEVDWQAAISAAGHGGSRLRGISRGGFELTQPHARQTQVTAELPGASLGSCSGRAAVAALAGWWPRMARATASSAR